MNREIFPGGIYPLAGDVESQAGISAVRVAGLQGVPIAQPTLNGGENLQYNVNTHKWTPTLRASILVNRDPVSDDYTITVNVARPVTVNGV